MSVWRLWDVIWTCFFTKPVCWQNSYVILEKSYISHMISFSAEIGRLIGLWVKNPTKLSLHQMDFCSSRYSSVNGRRSTLAEWEIWLWRLRFPCSFFFYFPCHIFIERYGCWLSNATEITSFRPLELKLCTKHRLKVKSVNYLQFTSF
jgi:hypothetical protein